MDFEKVVSKVCPKSQEPLCDYLDFEQSGFQGVSKPLCDYLDFEKSGFRGVSQAFFLHDNGLKRFGWPRT